MKVALTEKEGVFNSPFTKELVHYMEGEVPFRVYIKDRNDKVIKELTPDRAEDPRLAREILLLEADLFMEDLEEKKADIDIPDFRRFFDTYSFNPNVFIGEKGFLGVTCMSFLGLYLGGLGVAFLVLSIGVMGLKIWNHKVEAKHYENRGHLFKILNGRYLIAGKGDIPEKKMKKICKEMDLYARERWKALGKSIWLN